VCGNWQKATPLRPNVLAYSQINELVAHNHRVRTQLLKQDSPPRFPNQITSDPLEFQLFKSIQTLFHSCHQVSLAELEEPTDAHREFDEPNATKVMFENLKHMLSWWDRPLKFTNPPQWNNILEKLITTQNPILFQLDQITVEPRMTFSAPTQFGLSEDQWEDSEKVQLYNNTIAKTFEVLHGKRFVPFHVTSIYPNQKLYLMEGWSIDKSVPKSYSWASLAHDIVNFERSLIALAGNKSSPAQTMNLTQLRKTVPRFPWSRLIQKVIPFRSSINMTTVDVKDITYFMNVFKLMHRTNVEVLNYFLWWRLVLNQLEWIHPTLARTLFHGLNKHPQTKMTRETECLNAVSGIPLNRWFVASTFSPDARNEVQTMANGLIQEYEKQLDRIPWITESERVAFVNKVKHMKLHIGYPDQIANLSQRVLKSIPQLNPDDTFFINQIKIQSHQYDQKLIQFEPSELDWGNEVHDFNAYYGFETNGMVQKSFLFFFLFCSK
jgi:hypothetical protein